MSFVSRLLPNERTRHVVIAAAIACVLSFAAILEPIDRLIWTAESRINQSEVSGEIVYVRSKDDMSDPAIPERRVDLARTLDTLDKAGADRIFIDMVFDRPSSPQADAALGQAIAKLGDRVVLTHKIRSKPGQGEIIDSSIATIAGSAPSVVNERFVDYLGYTWEMPYSIDLDDQTVDSLPVGLAGVTGAGQDQFPIDYNFDVSSIPTLGLEELSSVDQTKGAFPSLEGATVLIDLDSPSTTDTANVPGYLKVPEAYVQILAAETLIRGIGPQVHWLTVLLVLFAGLFGVACFANRNGARAVGYILVAAMPFAFVYASAFTGTTPYVASCLALVAIYSLMRWWARRKQRQVMYDETIGLPTFTALERDLVKMGNVQGTCVVVAKLHRFEEVTSAMPNSSISEYVQQIANRFRIAEQDLQIYTKGGKYLAWVAEIGDREMLESHLRGLRAVFAHPLLINGTPIDVGITFAADMTAEDNASRKIASANSTLEKTTEAHEPVMFAEMASEGDRWWSISLQAKIDEALEQGHIYVVFQPKLNVRDNSVVGAEALVRWKDPERGNIAPNYFIEQCENAGRMDHLTRHVLQESLVAAKDFARFNARFTVSVNISATMLRDYRVAEMVEEVVEKTGYNPCNLVLEITETSRIADYDIAYDVMTRLRLHGIKLSIDDFGVGSASMETLLRLPFDELKIDRAFIAKMHEDQKARAISQMMIAFGKQTRITVVAEGVEDEASLGLLRSLGCEVVQGYHISRPLEREKFHKFQEVNGVNLSGKAING